MSVPDLQSLTSSEAVFSNPSHTLPQIRAIHKALHAAVDDKRDRLRVQVGASYRDLLGTADAIVAMGRDMETVMETLGRMGARCGRAAVGRKVGGLGEFVADEDENKDGGRLGDVGRARLVEGASLVVEGLIRERQRKGKGKGERLLLAAKVLVLGRLLVKSFGVKGERAVRGVVETAKRSLESSRRKLLRIIDKVLQTMGEKGQSEDDMLGALAAYSLVTSSGARDTLYHFVRVRGEAMKLAFELDEDERTTTADDVLHGMRLYTRTLLEVPALVPTKLIEALASLKKHPLIKDAGLRSLEGLRLDVYERWCGDEIVYFTPFIRHDDLDRSQAREKLAEWAKKGAEVLLQGLGKTLEAMSEFKAIVDLRTSVLKLWISEGGRVKGVDTSDLLDRIRALVNERMLGVVEAKVNKLRLVGSEVSSTIEAWRELGSNSNEPQDFWAPDSFDMELENGAAHFTQDVVARMHGRNDVVSKAVSSYKSWYNVIDDVGQVVEQLKRQRWDNDVDEIEDEETIDQRQQLLSKDDPQALYDHLNASLGRAFNTLDVQLGGLLDSSSGAASGSDAAVYLLRVVRDVRSNLPALESVKAFGLSLLPVLHKRVAVGVAERVLVSWSENLQSRVVGRGLWEGEPELPTSPSPGCFKFLRELSMAMSDAGMDLWYPALANALKEEVNRKLHNLWLMRVQELRDRPSHGGNAAKPEGGEMNGEPTEAPGFDQAHANGEAITTKDTKPEDDVWKEVLVQWLFDVAYLRRGLHVPPSADRLNELEEVMFRASGLDNAARQRFTRATQEYWKRTSLLFGLLA